MSIFDIESQPFQAIDYSPLNQGGSSGSGQAAVFKQLVVGAGADIFKVNQEGSFWGAASYGDAPAKINFQGDAIFNSVYIHGLSGATLAAAINVNGNWVNQVINTNLDTSTKKILGDFTFGASGAIRMNVDTNNGLWISPTGILGKTGGVTTFAIDTSGNATFKGTLAAGSVIAANINADLINAGTLVGRSVKATNGAGSDIWMENNGILSFRYGGSQKGYIYCNTGGTILFQATDGMYLTFNGDGGGDSFAIFDNADAALIIDSSRDVNIPGGSITVAEDIYCGGNYYSTGIVKGKHYSSDGTAGKTGPSTYGFVTAVESSRAKWRAFTVRDGIITSVSSESGWK